MIIAYFVFFSTYSVPGSNSCAVRPTAKSLTRLFALTIEASMETGCILKSSADWLDWFEAIKAYAEAYEVWQYLDPDSTEKRLSSLGYQQPQKSYHQRSTFRCIVSKSTRHGISRRNFIRSGLSSGKWLARPIAIFFELRTHGRYSYLIITSKARSVHTHRSSRRYPHNGIKHQYLKVRSRSMARYDPGCLRKVSAGR